MCEGNKRLAETTFYLCEYSHFSNFMWVWLRETPRWLDTGLWNRRSPNSPEYQKVLVSSKCISQHASIQLKNIWREIISVQWLGITGTYLTVLPNNQKTQCLANINIKSPLWGLQLHEDLWWYRNHDLGLGGYALWHTLQVLGVSV